ncbi:hypothetical protein [Candidatus Nitrosocosmicus sp. T]
MTQRNLCEDCQAGKHHDLQNVENCDCPCSNTVRGGDHTQGTPSDISDSRPSNVT